MKKAITCTVVGDAATSLFEKSKSRIENYASKIGVELIINRSSIRKYPYYSKMDSISSALKTHDRVISLDIDILIRRDCPDLFEMVPENMLGMYDERKLASEEQKEEHKKVVFTHLDFWGMPYPESGEWKFFNTGVLVASKEHEELFTVPEGEEMFGNYWDQGLLNAKLTSKEVSVFDIGYKMNRMPYIDKVIGEHRCWSYIVHYAGLQQLEIMNIDNALMTAYERNPEYFGKVVAKTDIKRI